MSAQKNSSAVQNTTDEFSIISQVESFFLKFNLLHFQLEMEHTFDQCLIYVVQSSLPEI